MGKTIGKFEKINIPIQNAELGTLRREIEIPNDIYFKKQYEEANQKAKTNMKRFMTDLPKERMSEGYMRDEYGYFDPYFDIAIIPSRMSCEGSTMAFTRIKNVSKNERITIIEYARRTFSVISESIIDSMISTISTTMNFLLNAESKSKDTKYFYLNKLHLLDLTMLDAYGTIDDITLTPFKVTPNTVETIAMNIFTNVQCTLSTILTTNYDSFEDPHAIMDKFYQKYANDVGAFIYDTLIELVRVATLMQAGLNTKDISYAKFVKDFTPSVTTEIIED